MGHCPAGASRKAQTQLDGGGKQIQRTSVLCRLRIQAVFCPRKNDETDAFNFICSRYRKHMGEKQCTPHSIREIALDEIILEEIRRVTSEARKHTAEFVRFISQKSSSENRKELNAKLSEQGKLTKRTEELNLLFKRLYEDNVLGKVTNEQFRMLSDGYNAEQKTTVERLEQLKVEIEQLKSTAINVERFVSLARK